MKTQEHILVSASAGSGKTYRLMNEVFGEVKNGLKPEGLIASTFTVKAAGELRERIRLKIIGGGRVETSRTMGLALIGTVHSVCAEILRRFAFDQGSSLRQEIVVDEQKTRLFRDALNESMSPADFSRLEGYSVRFSVSLKELEDHIGRIVDLARQNHIGPDDLDRSIQASLELLKEAVPASNPSHAGVQAKLRGLLDAYAGQYPVNPPDEVGLTATAHKNTLEAFGIMRSSGGELPWKDWIKLTKLKPSKGTRHIYEPMVDTARLMLSSPEFRSDMEGSVKFFFELAQKSMVRYTDKKKALGLVDYSDLELLALQLLDRPEVQDRLRAELELLMIDEFQDTNPVQLGIFTKLGKLCKKVVWVGDLKQSIYGFRGSDPWLMSLAMEQVEKGFSGAKREVLPNNYRSAQGVVAFNNEVFTRAFEVDGVPASEIRQVPEWPHQIEGECVEVWRSKEGRQDNRGLALARGIRSLLKSGRQVIDKETKQPRPIQPGDIAILARTNKHLENFSNGLLTLGIPVSMGGGKLLKMPEVVLALAAYRYLLNPRDRIAAGELALGLGMNPDQWLQGAMLQQKESDMFPALATLDSARERSKGMGVREKLDLAIAVSGLPDWISRLEGGAGRLFHVSALRQLGIQYEEACLASFSPCSDSGFLSFIEEEEPEIPASAHSGAVNLMTFHASKGLEWPVVILGSLNTKPISESLFESRAGIQAGATFSLENPLKDRVITDLKWPFGDHERIDDLEVFQQNSKTLEKRAKETRAENRRLLYVGMTRAKERLVLFNENFTKDSLDVLLGALAQGGTPVIRLPEDSELILVGGKSVPCRYVELDTISLNEAEVGSGKKTLSPPESKPIGDDLQTLFLQPSKMPKWRATGHGLTIKEVITFGQDTLLSRAVKVEEGESSRKDELGTAVHLFLGSDDSKIPRAKRVAQAQAIIERFNVRSSIASAEALVAASDRFIEKMESLWPGQFVHREVPVEFELEGSIVRGSMDAFILTETEAVIIDHKASLKRADEAIDVLKNYASQLEAYMEAVRRAYPWKKVRAFLHNPDGWLAEVK